MNNRRYQYLFSTQVWYQTYNFNKIRHCRSCSRMKSDNFLVCTWVMCCNILFQHDCTSCMDEEIIFYVYWACLYCSTVYNYTRFPSSFLSGHVLPRPSHVPLVVQESLSQSFFKEIGLCFSFLSRKAETGEELGIFQVLLTWLEKL